MRRIAALALVIAALPAVLTGCGGASPQELHEARERGEQVGQKLGHEEAWAEAKKEIAQAREDAYWEGSLDGEEEAYELEEELEEEGQYSSPGPGQYSGDRINPHPANQYGEPSYEFEPDDIERAEEGYEDEALREYCEEAVSEAQEVGCLSHVDPSEVP